MNEDPPSLAALPRAAAVTGVAFALLSGAALLMVRLSIPGSIVERGGWLADPAGNLRLATHLLAWGGIAFLWFIGVVRTHIGGAGLDGLAPGQWRELPATRPFS